MAELIYEKFRTYDWDEDEAFKTGVQKVLELKHMDIGSPEAQGLKDQYKFYYFTKRFAKIDRTAYESWRSQMMDVEDDEPVDPNRPWFQQKPPKINPASMASEGAVDTGPSFDDIVELITTGRPVPGIREIPNQLASESPSPSSGVASPKKPWEA